MDYPTRKINLISCDPMDHVSDIKLIRTDTTLDLSQKAEKEPPTGAPIKTEPILNRLIPGHLGFDSTTKAPFNKKTTE
ncbi:hypothetical protein ES288_A02G062400v1 [Gossypium darwinii]|uniref:Uncharacterized protein n=2 Tax=Gossypium TaxID=3633 RepID=A0A5D2RGM5_GOSTO|nr:hypothetical protein ES288_A02G062400v1 [Gossypium darwinii]TYI38905.1 hypothetical protein ES332_A02G061700v1 [Gossypium tomentosum]